MAWPLPSVIPEAVRNSVSMRSEITGARAGINDRSCSSLALCQAPDFLSSFRGPLDWVAACAVWAKTATISQTMGTQRSLVKMHDSPLQRGGGRLGPVGDAQLAEQAVDVGLHRGLGNVERGR